MQPFYIELQINRPLLALKPASSCCSNFTAYKPNKRANLIQLQRTVVCIYKRVVKILHEPHLTLYGRCFARNKHNDHAEQARWTRRQYMLASLNCNAFTIQTR